MTRFRDPRAILGIDPTSRGLAFVYFENGRLLDWGTRRVPGDDLAAYDRVRELCPPEVLVIEDANANRCGRRSRVREVLSALEWHARGQGTDVVKVGRDSVRREWALQGCPNKHGVAQAIAEVFPALEPLVPRERKPYRSEVVRAEIFDAASLVIHAIGMDLHDRQIDT
jgi:hypothetical protein